MSGLQNYKKTTIIIITLSEIEHVRDVLAKFEVNYEELEQKEVSGFVLLFYPFELQKIMKKMNVAHSPLWENKASSSWNFKFGFKLNY